MRFVDFLVPIISASCLLGCGGNVVVDGGASSGGGASSTGSIASTSTTGGVCTQPSGDCATDADCPGGTCAPLTPGGYLVCLHVAPPSSSCAPANPMDQCCSSTECANGARCYSTQVLMECGGGPAMPIFKECAADECAADTDCPGDSAPRICEPAGAFKHPLRQCLAAYCHTDADCTAGPCGACVPVTQPCCDYPAGLACLYPGGCRKNEDCGAGNSCQINPAKGTGECMTGMGICPV